MKLFDVDEQRIISKINKGSGYERNLINIIDSKTNLHYTRICIDQKKRKADFLFQIEKEDATDKDYMWGIERQKELVEFLMKHAMLLRYLEKEELAIFFESTKHNDETIEFGMGAVNMPWFSMAIEDQNLVDLLIKYSHKEIMPSPSLRQLENNNFKSFEEIKFNKQHVATWSAIAVSLLIGIVSIFSSYQNSKNQKKMLNAQLDGNSKVVESISDNIRNLDKSQIDYRPAMKEISNQLSDIATQINWTRANKTIGNQPQEKKK